MRQQGSRRDQKIRAPSAPFCATRHDAFDDQDAFEHD
jgi:hypothetical protein